MEILKVMVFEVARPFFGVTVTVTLQEPAFNPLRVVPETLQKFAELATTFIPTFEVERTLSLANPAIDLAEAALESFTVGAVVTGVETTGTVAVAEAGAFTFRLGFGAEKCFKLKSTTTPPEAEAKVSICETSTAAAALVFSKIVPVKTLEGFAIIVATSAAETAPPACDIDAAIIANGTYILKNAGFNDFPFSCASPVTPKSAGT